MNMNLTDATCGDACWHAREDICRCSCAGANHGVLRSNGAAQPNRTRRIKVNIYEMAAVESAAECKASCRAASSRPIYDAHHAVEAAGIAAGRYRWQDICRSDNNITYPSYVKTASDAEVARWPELAAWRGMRYDRPLVLWTLVSC